MTIRKEIIPNSSDMVSPYQRALGDYNIGDGIIDPHIALENTMIPPSSFVGFMALFGSIICIISVFQAWKIAASKDGKTGLAWVFPSVVLAVGFGTFAIMGIVQGFQFLNNAKEVQDDLNSQLAHYTQQVHKDSLNQAEYNTDGLEAQRVGQSTLEFNWKNKDGDTVFITKNAIENIREDIKEIEVTTTQ